MSVSSRCLFLAVACMMAAAIVACDKNDAAPSANPSPSPSPSPTPSPSPSPSPTPSPSPASFTISGRVAETAPTTDRFLDGVSLSTGEKSTNTNGAGQFTLDGLTEGAHSLRASKGGYGDQVITVTLPADAGRIIEFNLEPQSDRLNRERSGIISGDNSPCHGGSLPCVRYDFPVHHSDSVSASLLWTSSDAELNLELRCNGELIVRQTTRNEGEVSRDGETYLSMDLEGEAQKGKMCEVRILHVDGPEQKYILVVSHPN